MKGLVTRDEMQGNSLLQPLLQEKGESGAQEEPVSLSITPWHAPRFPPPPSPSDKAVFSLGISGAPHLSTSRSVGDLLGAQTNTSNKSRCTLRRVSVT